jgi:hypothetical protein
MFLSCYAVGFELYILSVTIHKAFDKFLCQSWFVAYYGLTMQGRKLVLSRQTQLGVKSKS